MQARFIRKQLHFKAPAGTSRGVLRTKNTWYLILENESNVGVGECAMFAGLSADDTPFYEDVLGGMCELINGGEMPSESFLEYFPSIRFGLEQALVSFNGSQGKTLEIPINGLVWMGEKESMLAQIKQKIEQGFGCIKIKIGAINFEDEISLLAYIRKQFSSSQIEIRVDANGAFSQEDALEKLKRLSEYSIHSIEQPIRAGQYEQMARLCENPPMPIALDEELIGVFGIEKKRELLKAIKPQYIVLKPSLIGGIKGSDEWVGIADEFGCGYWITSALESNVGLCAIARYADSKGLATPQGLGTGELFTNNIKLPMSISHGKLIIDNDMPSAKNIIRQL